MVKNIGTKKTGIFGGSFDPVHLGHVSLARDAMKAVGLDRVIFIPAGLQPFKLDKKVTPGKDRLEMLKLATEGEQDLEISDLELVSSEISYTYLTLRRIKKILNPEEKIYFITGTDSFLKIKQWKNSCELLENYSYIIGTRPGYRKAELDSCIESIRHEYNTEIINIDNTQMDISSTDIRTRLGLGGSVKGMICEGVERYIKEHGLYGRRNL